MPNADIGERVVRAFAWLLLTAWLVVSAAFVWLMLVFPDEKRPISPRDLPIFIEPGSSVEIVARRLAEAGVVQRPRAFVVYLRVLGADRKLRSGWVVGNRALTARNQLARVARGYGQSSVQVVIPEGFTSFDVATRLERYGVARRSALLAAMREPALLSELAIPAGSAEGYLFPAQYGFGLDTPARRVVTRMVTTFQSRTAALFARHGTVLNGAPTARLTPHEIVTLASIVEREARVPEERATIAGVFVNRLLDPDFRPKRLQADPTVAYGCLVAGARVPSCREFDGRHITPAMVRDPENPYSTYRHEGLPPGPICNPGLAALTAVVTPEPHGYFYFVAKGGGRHAFARSLDEHNRNVRPSTSAPVEAP
jgi:UPF0755 protein